MAVLQDPILADLALPTLECDRIDCDYLKCTACPPIRLCSRHLVSSLVSLAPHLCEDASGARVAAKRGSVPQLAVGAATLPTNQALRGGLPTCTQENLKTHSIQSAGAGV